VATRLILILIVISAILLLIFFRPISLWGDTRYDPVFTGSMAPVIPVGGLVVIKPVDSATLRPGDIICFKFSEKISITHRIINITNEGFVTKGDANENPDQYTVKKEDVVGKVLLVIPFLGYLGSFVRTPIGLILLIVLPAAVLILLEIRSTLRKMEEMKGSQTRHYSCIFTLE
jgi:signal peptidase